MDRLRKWMTILAIVGTVLLTAVFCYMPFREMIKEMNKKSVSLKEEKVIGDTEDEPEELHQHITDMSGGQKAEKDGGQETLEDMEEKEVRKLQGVSFEVTAGDEKLEVFLWQNKEGICYAFLPGFAKNGGIRAGELNDSGFMTIGSRVFKSGDVIEDISFEDAYEFALYDKDEQQVVKAPLIFMRSSDIPVVSIATDSGTMEYIHENKENEEAGRVTVFDEQGILLYEGEAQAIKGRGNSTWGLSKKPYQLKLEEKTDLFGFGEGSNFVLLADGYDETGLRNKIALSMAQELGMPYTPEGRWVDLYCNGEYYGIYFLCEKIEVGKNRVDIADMEANSSLVYAEAEVLKLDVIVSEDGKRKWTDSEVEEPDITGGYLFERELSDRYEEEVSGFVTDQGDAYALQSPKYATENQVNYIADRMQEFQDAVEEEDGVNRETGKHYTEYIDMESFVKKYLVEEVSRNYDGGVTSSFFYKPDDSVSTKIFAGPVWDYDVAFGNCNLDEIVSNPEGLSKLNDHVYGTDIFARLYEKEDFYRQVTAVYKEKVLPYLNRLLEGEIDTLSQEIRQSVRLDSIRYEDLENRYQYYESYDNNVRYLKYFIEKRRDFLNEVWLQGEVYHSVTFEVDGESWKKIYVKDGETPGYEPVPSRYSSLFMGWLSEEHDVPYDEYKPVYEDVTFYATWQELPVSEVVITAGGDGDGPSGSEN